MDNVHKQAIHSTLLAGLAKLEPEARRAFISGAYAEIVGYDPLAEGWTEDEALDIYTLPKPENRCGYELRCQVVRPDEPLSDAA